MLAASNIAWSKENDDDIFAFLNKCGFSGLEIAPTRIIPEKPYDNNDIIKEFSRNLKEKYNLSVISMQSIWFGRRENMFESETSLETLKNYTEKAVLFAAACGCGNLVFGCPKNRNMADKSKYGTAVKFFKELGDFAYNNGAVISIEPNPAIYNTNFINTTEEAFILAKETGSSGIGVNVDFGTIIQNKESLEPVFDNMQYVRHIHISEPYLKPVERRKIHNEFAAGLRETKYGGFVSLEAAKPDNMNILKNNLEYIAAVFG